MPGPTVPRKASSGKSAAKSTPSLTNRITKSLNSLKNLVKVIVENPGIIAPGAAFGSSVTGKPTKTDVSVKKQLVKGSKGSGKTTPDGVEFNLPPHLWSLPINPINRVNVTSNYLTATDSDDIRNNIGTNLTVDHSLRRGKMWLYSELLSNEPTTTSSDTTNSNTKNEGGRSVTNTGLSTINRGLYLAEQAAADAAYKKVAASYIPSGFQFLWNPETVQVSVSTNPEIVPDAGDRFRSVVGVFPSTEHVTFSLVLDRTNDFACAYRDFYNNKQDIVSIADRYEKYYKTGYNQNLRPFSDKLQELMVNGTMHDVEYIFKMLNAGTIFANIQPTNPLGKKTFDLGYLYPALTAVQFGPSTGNLSPISYVGWLQSISFRHTAFNTNMVPLRTEVSFDLWVYTGFGQTNEG